MKKLLPRLFAVALTTLVLAALFHVLLYGSFMRTRINPIVIEKYELQPVLDYIALSDVDVRRLHGILRPPLSFWQLLLPHAVGVTITVCIYGGCLWLGKRLLAHKEITLQERAQPTDGPLSSESAPCASPDEVSS